MQNLKEILILFIIVSVIDLIWLKLVMVGPYTKMVQKIQNKPLRLKPIPAILSYVCITGLLYLLVKNNHQAHTDLIIFLTGLFAYGIYDMTNLAIFDDFDPKWAVIDMIWGGVLFYLSSKVYKKVINKI